MGSLPRPFALLFALPLASACAKVTAPSDDVCISWTDEPHVVEGALPSEGYRCEPGDRGEYGSVHGDGVVPDTLPWRRVEVCTNDEDCEDLRAAASSVAVCLETEEGEGCEPGWAGCCVQTKVWSVCGPDPATVRGCCYEAILIQASFCE